MGGERFTDPRKHIARVTTGIDGGNGSLKSGAAIVVRLRGREHVWADAIGVNLRVLLLEIPHFVLLDLQFDFQSPNIVCNRFG